MDETKLNELQEDINSKNAVEERFINLNKRAKEAEEKAQTFEKAKAESDAKIAQMEKETSFLNSFSDVTAKFPMASEYKDKIKEKVMSGYSVDDATVSILVSEGKYTPPKAPIENVGGGSAPNQIVSQGTKSVAEMSREERWEALKDAERKGYLGLS
jgi:hypothetical protein